MAEEPGAGIAVADDGPQWSERDQFIFQLCVEGGASYRQAEKQLAALVATEQRPQDWAVSHATVGRVVQKMLDSVTDERRTDTEALVSKQVVQQDRLIQMATVIARGQKCPVCDGKKTVWKDPTDRELGQQVCPKCDGHGMAWNEDTRLRAMVTVVRIQERQAKLLGLDRPTKIAGPGGGPIPVTAVDVESLDERQLESEVRGFFAGGGVIDVPSEGVRELAPGSANGGAALTDQDQGPGSANGGTD